MIKDLNDLLLEKELFTKLLKEFRQKWINEIYSRSEELQEIIFTYREMLITVNKKISSLK